MTYKLSVVCVKLDDSAAADSSQNHSISHKGSEMGTPTGSGGQMGLAAADAAGAVAVPNGSNGSSSSQRQGGGSGRGSGGGLGGCRGSGGSGGGEAGLCKPRGHHLVPGLVNAASGMVAGMVEVVSPYDVLPPG